MFVCKWSVPRQIAYSAATSLCLKTTERPLLCFQWLLGRQDDVACRSRHANRRDKKLHLLCPHRPPQELGKKVSLFPNRPTEGMSSSSTSPKRRGAVSKCEHLHVKQACGHQSPVTKPCTAQTRIGGENSLSFVTEGDNNNHTPCQLQCQDELRASLVD